jgi:hypothetical protein
MRTIILIGLLCAVLAGCTDPILVSNPTNGQVAQCLATGAFPIIAQHQCVSSYENLGWKRTNAAEVVQDREQRTTELNAQVKEAMDGCMNARLSGVLKGYLASAQCSTPKVRELYVRSGYPFMDLIELALAARESDAEKVDEGKMTLAEFRLHFAQINEQIAQEEMRRLSNAQAASERAQANQIAADAVRAQTLLSLQKMNNDNFNAQQQRQLDYFRAGQPTSVRVQTTCTNIGITTTCN